MVFDDDENAEYISSEDDDYAPPVHKKRAATQKVQWTKVKEASPSIYKIC